MLTSSVFIHEFAESNCKLALHANFEHSLLRVSSTSACTILSINMFWRGSRGLIKSGCTAHLKDTQRPFGPLKQHPQIHFKKKKTVLTNDNKIVLIVIKLGINITYENSGSQFSYSMKKFIQLKTPLQWCYLQYY